MVKVGHSAFCLASTLVAMVKNTDSLINRFHPANIKGNYNIKEYNETHK